MIKLRYKKKCKGFKCGVFFIPKHFGERYCPECVKKREEDANNKAN